MIVPIFHLFKESFIEPIYFLNGSDQNNFCVIVLCHENDVFEKLAAGTFVYASYGEPSGVYKAQIIERRHDDMYKIKWLGGDVGYLWKPRRNL